MAVADKLVLKGRPDAEDAVAVADKLVPTDEPSVDESGVRVAVSENDVPRNLCPENE